MSTSTLANIVRQMRSQGETQVVLDVEGEAVTIELRPAPKPVKLSPAKTLLRMATQAFHQNARNN